jgi:hypothetical protein
MQVREEEVSEKIPAAFSGCFGLPRLPRHVSYTTAGRSVQHPQNYREAGKAYAGYDIMSYQRWWRWESRRSALPWTARP